MSSSSSSSGEDEKEKDQPEAEEDEAVKAEVVVETEAEEEEEEDEEPKEDPAFTALKEEIASLEIELKAKRVKLSSVQDLADDYTENGYRRKCAEIDNMRRMRTQVSASNQVTSRARILADFLPVLENLQALDVAYADNDFSKGYGALPRDFENCLVSLDVTEFTVESGVVYDPARCTVVSEEDSSSETDAGTAATKGVVLRVEAKGYEVQGNVIRPAKVVVSLGKEEEEEEEAAAEEKKEEEVVEEEK